MPKTIFFFIAGIILQVWLTKDGIYHEEQFPPIKRRRNKHETREERKQRKYRYLYQVSFKFLSKRINPKWNFAYYFR